MHMPESLGSPGPGEIIICVYLEEDISFKLILSFFLIFISEQNSLTYW